MAEPRGAHMPQDVSAGGVLIAAIAIGGGIAVSIAVAQLLVHEANVGSAVKPPEMAGAPKLQAEPAVDIANFNAEKRRQLTGYAWVDRERGIVRIPIERAMDLLSRPKTP